MEGLHELDTAEQSKDSSENKGDSFHLQLPPPIPGGLLRSRGKEGEVGEGWLGGYRWIGSSHIRHVTSPTALLCYCM